MEGLNGAYWLKHWRTILGTALCGLALSLLILMLHWNWHTVVLSMLPGALLSSPYTLKSSTGRLWWAMLLFADGCLAAAGYFGGHSVFGWLCGLMVPCAFGIVGCLRWHAPGPGEG